MELAKITARGQTTIPKSIRTAANLSEGDVIAFEVRSDHLDLRGLSQILGEWTSPEDEAAWRDL